MAQFRNRRNEIDMELFLQTLVYCQTLRWEEVEEKCVS